MTSHRDLKKNISNPTASAEGSNWHDGLRILAGMIVKKYTDDQILNKTNDENIPECK